MSLLVISGATIRLGGRSLLDDADLMVDPGRRIGLVGRNGAGKSTLLRAIAGELAMDGGEIRLARGARMATVKQEAPSGAASLLETVLEGDTERLALLAEAETADPHRLGRDPRPAASRSAPTPPPRAPPPSWPGWASTRRRSAAPVSEFSGGWRMRVALATALFANPDLLLLDEPTNHLDLEATLWLEAWLARFPGAALVVSHDRGLLDRAVEAIAHLDRGKLSLTPGGFEDFVRIRTERALQQTRAAEKIAAERAHIQSFVDRFRAKATKARQAQARIKALERLPQIEAVIEDAPTRFAFPEPARIAPPILALDRVDVGYDGTPVLRGLSLTVDMDDRIALLGANGNGKSTLAKLLAGPAGAAGRRGPARPEAARRLFRPAPGRGAGRRTRRRSTTWPAPCHAPRRRRCARSSPGSAWTPTRAETPVANLSGGEKARLLLALATRDAPQSADPGRADQPSGHRRARGAGEGAGRLPGRGAADHPRPASGGAGRRPAVAGRRTARCGRSTATWTTTARCWRSGAGPPPRPMPSPAATTGASGPRRARRWRRCAGRRRRPRQRLPGSRAERAAIEARLADPALYETGRASEITAANARLAAIAKESAAAELVWFEAAEALEASS